MFRDLAPPIPPEGFLDTERGHKVPAGLKKIVDPGSFYEGVSPSYGQMSKPRFWVERLDIRLEIVLYMRKRG